MGFDAVGKSRTDFIPQRHYSFLIASSYPQENKGAGNSRSNPGTVHGAHQKFNFWPDLFLHDHGIKVSSSREIVKQVLWLSSNQSLAWDPFLFPIRKSLGRFQWGIKWSNFLTKAGGSWEGWITSSKKKKKIFHEITSPCIPTALSTTFLRDGFVYTWVTSSYEYSEWALNKHES